MPLSKIPSAGFQDNVKFRNIIINGDMSIVQRGTSVTNADTGYRTCDRWRLSRGAGTITMSQATDAPTGSGFVKSLKFLEAGSGANPGASDANIITQRIEGQNLQYLLKGTSSAKSLILSFWIKASVTGTYIANLTDDDNSRFISKAYTVSSANTWEYKTVTFEGDTTGAFANDNGRSLDLNLYFGAGSNFTSGTLNTSWNSYTAANQAVGQVNPLASANGYVQWTGVQLEAGTTASDFEFLPFDINLSRCNRYYTTSQQVSKFGEFATGDENGIFFGRLSAFSNQPCNHRFPVRMRSEPTVTVYSLTGTSGHVSDTGTTAGSHSSNDGVNTARVSQSGIGYITDLSGGSGDGYAFQYEADAEL